LHQIPTIRQLAAKSGFSRTTVSLALRNSPLISAETRGRILRIAGEMGYRPDTVVSNLMGQLRIRRRERGVEKLAYLTSWPTREGWRKHPGNRDYFLGVTERANELGYAIDEVWAREPRLTGKRLSKILDARAIRGIVIAPLLTPIGHLSLDWRHFAGAIISFTAIKPSLHRTSHSHYQGMALALRQLKYRGYRRIGLAMLSDQNKRVNQQWLASYLAHQYSLTGASRIPPFLDAGWEIGRFKAWMERHRPDAVVSNMPEPVYFLRDLGYGVPEEVGYASLDRLEPDDPWAGVDQLPKRVGAAATDLVAAQLRNHAFGIPECAKTVLIDGVWRDGPSLRSRRVLASAEAGSPARDCDGGKLFGEGGNDGGNL